jgi:arginine-tRNA-protein transferase
LSGPSPSQRLLLYATPAHECSYIPAREAVTLFADPDHPKDPWLQGALTEQGFRRSGRHIYRPRCPQCSACEPVRVCAQAFAPNRSQRRTWRRNRDLQVQVREQSFVREHYDLYVRYVTQRHPDGGMDDPTPGKYEDFLLCPWSDTRLIEFRECDELIAVAVSDRLPEALSAVYTFFAPEHESRGLGVYAVLWQIHAARQAGMRWLYLGYAIDACRKMAYKQLYRPQERFRNGRWEACGGS